MDTIRVGIRYRPLRIAWAIRQGDFGAFRTAVRLSYALWGGQFNPILVVDDHALAKKVISVFHPDLIWPVEPGPEVKAFIDRFPHLGQMLLHDSIYIGGAGERRLSQVLDLSNAVAYWADRPEWHNLVARGARFYDWEPSDPLFDVFLVHLGAFPGTEVTGLDFRAMISRAGGAIVQKLDPNSPVSEKVLAHPTIPDFAKFGLSPRWQNRVGLDSPGFFVGDATNLVDLVTHWNLRAANISLLFVDRENFARYRDLAPAWEGHAREVVARRHEWEREVTLWYREDSREAAARLFPKGRLLHCTASDDIWNGLALQPPVMQLGEATVLGAVSRGQARPSVSFELGEKPYSSEAWSHTQHLVASASFNIGLYDDDRHTLTPPYLPELNEGWGREMVGDPDGLRLEPGRLGLVVDSTETDVTLFALGIDEVFEQTFAMAGYRAALSPAGLITRQLIAQLGGLQGARVFKIPGVRRLLRTHGPFGTFTRKSAIELIGKRDPANPTASFDDHEDLYIEPREIGKLKPHHAFGFLVQRGVFRIGAGLRCSHCPMELWVALDELKQRVVCEMCGTQFETTRQLAEGEFRYRRSGVMGKERNAQGAVPVALTLQQLDANLSDFGAEALHSASLELSPEAGVDLPKCEVDFVWVIPRPHRNRSAIILGECKDQGPIRLDDFTREISNLHRVAEAMPRDRFKTFVLLSKLAPFTPEEINSARALNDEHQLRAILLTPQELEPYRIYERTTNAAGSRRPSNTPEELASATFERYFLPLGDRAIIGQDA